MRFIAGIPGEGPDVGDVVPYRGETMLVFKTGTSVSFVGGTLLFAGGLERAAPGHRPGPRRRALSPPLRPTCATSRDVGRVRRGDGGPWPPIPWPRCSSEADEGRPETRSPAAARFGLDAQVKDGLRGLLELTYADADEAAAAREGVANGLRREAPAGCRRAGARMNAKLRQEGPRILLEVDGNGVAAALGRSVATRQRELGRHPTPRP